MHVIKQFEYILQQQNLKKKYVKTINRTKLLENFCTFNNIGFVKLCLWSRGMILFV